MSFGQGPDRDYAAVINKVDECGRTRLHEAAVAGKQDDVRHLLIGGFDPNLTDTDGRTPLHYAALQGDSLSILRLLNYTKPDAAANTRNNAGDTPLHLYLRPSPGKAVPPDGQGLRYFLHAGADVCLPGSDGLTPLQILKLREDASQELVDLLVHA